MMESTIKYQSTAWLDSGNLYSPNYRQAHYKVFDEFRWENGGKRAFELAYEDIKRSFEVYLQKYNEGRPIIIAGHSQGSGHAIRLLQDFFDGKKLKSKLIAAYLPGTRVTSNDFFDLDLIMALFSFILFVLYLFFLINVLFFVAISPFQTGTIDDHTPSPFTRDQIAAPT